MKKESLKNLKFDLVNIVNDTVMILELKNRIDSGGVDARHGSLSKKFYPLGRLIENDDKIFSYEGRQYTFTELLPLFGIKRVDMYLVCFIILREKRPRSMMTDMVMDFIAQVRQVWRNMLTNHPII